MDFGTSPRLWMVKIILKKKTKKKRKIRIMIKIFIEFKLCFKFSGIKQQVSQVNDIFLLKLP